MYKTPIYTPVNGNITHKNSDISQQGVKLITHCI